MKMPKLKVHPNHIIFPVQVFLPIWGGFHLHRSVIFQSWFGIWMSVAILLLSTVFWAVTIFAWSLKKSLRRLATCDEQYELANIMLRADIEVMRPVAVPETVHSVLRCGMCGRPIKNSGTYENRELRIRMQCVEGCQSLEWTLQKQEA